jgi:hypothetical protein
MKSKISSQVFEWLLAQWAGFGENPADVFPSLRDADLADLQAQLNNAIRYAQTGKTPILIKKIPASRQ